MMRIFHNKTFLFNKKVIKVEQKLSYKIEFRFLHELTIQQIIH